MKDQPKGFFHKLSYLTSTEANSLHLKPSHSHYSQIQSQMAITKTCNTDFVVWSPKDILILDIPFDFEHWNKLLAGCVFFFTQHLGPALLQDATKDTDVNNAGLIPSTSRDTFLQQYVCSNEDCKEVLKDRENITCDGDESIQCDCHCDCQRWYHIRCTNLKLSTKHDLRDMEWICQKCVKDC